MFEIDKLNNTNVYLKDDDGLCVTGRDIKNINQLFKTSINKKWFGCMFVR